MQSLSLDLRSARLLLAVLALATIAVLASVAMTRAGAPIPVESDGGTGGEIVLPVEPDGGIGGEVILPVEPDGGIGN